MHVHFKYADIPYRTSSVPKGYTSENPPPVLGSGDEDNFCPHCFFAPCVLQTPPDFLRGSSDASFRNRQHRYRLYRGFWRLFKDLWLWRDDRYLEVKRRLTSEDDPRERLPLCVVQASAYIYLNYMNFFNHHYDHCTECRKLGSAILILQTCHTPITNHHGEQTLTKLSSSSLCTPQFYSITRYTSSLNHYICTCIPHVHSITI